MGFAEQFRLPLQPPGELLEVVFIDGLEKLGHDDRLPRADDRLPGASVRLRMFGQIVDEAAPPTPSLHSFSKSPVKFDTTGENESGDRPMLEPAGPEERLHHRGGVITGVSPRCGKTILHTVVVTQCRQNIEPTRQNTLARKELQYSLGTGTNCVFPYRRIRDGSSV